VLTAASAAPAVVHTPAAPRRAGRAGRLETIVVSTALGLLTAHVVDDAFLQPEPGTRAVDHLTGGLGLALVLGGLAVAHRFLRPGLRAGLAALVAIGAGGIGAEAVAAWGSSTLADDDFTGLVALLAAPLLAGAAAVVLWRSRRRRRWWVSLLRRAVIGVMAVFVAFVVALPIAISYTATHIRWRAEQPPPLGVTAEDLTIRTDDGLDLAARYVPSRNGAAILVLPGRAGPASHARMLASHGYGVLMLDHRGSGASPGEANILGWNRLPDVRAGLDFLRSRPEVDPARIGGLGLSVGGETLLEAAAGTEDLSAVVSEGAGIRSYREERHLPFGYQILGWPSWIVSTASTAWFAGEAPPPDLVDLAARIGPRPVLLIHAEVGTGGEELNPYYERAIGSSATRWEIPGDDHIGGIRVAPAEYERRVVGFFDEALPGRPHPRRAT
jgi:uncharacterized protein